MDGPGDMARFFFPTGVAVDGQGNIIIADQFNHRIRSIATDGNVTTIAGDGTRAFMDGPGDMAKFRNPEGVAVDGQGNIIIADASNHSIRSIDPNDNFNVTTIAGDGTAAFMDGPGDMARFAGPTGVAVDGQGNIIIADQANRRIRSIVCAPPTPTPLTIQQTNFSCEDPLNCVIDGISYFNDTLVITTNGVTGLNITTAPGASQVFIDVPCNDGSLTTIADATTIPEFPVGSGTYRLQFWRPSNAFISISILESGAATPVPTSLFPANGYSIRSE